MLHGTHNASVARPNMAARRRRNLFPFNGRLSQNQSAVKLCRRRTVNNVCSYWGPFDTPHVRGSFAPRARERDRLIMRLLCTNYASVHDYPFSFPSVPRPMGGKYFRVAYSMAGMHSTRSSCCTRRISLATRNYKLIRNQRVSPSMTDETASSPLVLAKAIEFRCTVQKENADWEYLIREDLNELSYCLAQNPLSRSLAGHHNGLLRWRVTA